MTLERKPARWQGSDDAIRAVQVAFDVEQAVLEAVRRAAFEANLSTSDQIRRLLDLPTPCVTGWTVYPPKAKPSRWRRA